MSERLHKQVGKAIIVHPPTMRVLILRLEANERAKRSTPEKEYDEWHVPGGGIEVSDNNSTEAATIREAKEETGLAVKVIHKLGSANWSAFYEGQPAGFTADFYLCTTGEDLLEPPTVQIGVESEASVWVAVDELGQYKTHGLTSEADTYIRQGVTKLQEEMLGE